MADDANGTVTFKLTAPDPDLLQKLAIPLASVVPELVGLAIAFVVRPRLPPAQRLRCHSLQGDLGLAVQPCRRHIMTAVSREPQS